MYDNNLQLTLQQQSKTDMHRKSTKCLKADSLKYMKEKI